MKNLIHVSIISLLYIGCIKAPTPQPVRIPTEIKYEDTVRPAIIVGETFEGCVLTQNNNIESLDTFLNSNLFTIYKYNPTSSLFNTLKLYFQTNLPGYRILNAKWLIGNETSFRTGSIIALDFDQPVPNLMVKLIVNWRYKAGMLSYSDTLQKIITISSESKVFGDYYGSNTDDTSFKYTVTLGNMIGNLYGSPYDIWGIKNLMIGYPYQLEITPKTNGFGLCGGPSFREVVTIGGKKYSDPYGRGFLNVAKDSLVVDYSYRNINSLTLITDSISRKRFLGKKIR